MDNQFVSRGGLKLEHALKTFGVNAAGLIVLDVGSSTGGFVDCLLQHGVAKVYSVDTAYGELAWKLRQDPRVVVIERQNILFLDNLPELVDLVTVDVTFTSLTKILPLVKKFMKPDPSTSLRASAKIIALLKPQYEDQQLAMKHHGIIPEEDREKIVDQIISFATDNGYTLLNKTESPIAGTGGNKEYLLYLSLKKNHSLGIQ